MRRLRQRKANKAPEISMLNLIDVIFTMLIFFMVATTFNNYGQLGLTLPEIETEAGQKVEKDQIKDQKIEVLLNKDKQYFLKIDDEIKSIDINNLNSELAFLKENKEKNVMLTADKSLEYGLIIELMGKLKNIGIKNVNLNIQETSI